ncbi:AadS family aminoglycoside 6-adenylyltransferase [Flavobacterium sp. NST-5]|uniref:AadS family aminoglycoside 6-adenylyltransferase n=1 Tax=Flavobacterium ichthyis TaxID=2698827 RepID=A0ABW9Z9N4_9FLAO|nr:AadS family aminoglycoside 6-adenylyltransferase [Flavobacterium ichthyis]NBL65597.1 AadS family aminoglycoside 6-adenylyltransferase [Flavobacterium ichthyis]
MNEDAREKKLKAIVDWSQQNVEVRAVLLTSSLANLDAPVDQFSDLDIELILENNTDYISDNMWIHNFGRPIAKLEEDESCFNGEYAMKMVLYNDYVKVDFKLYSKANFLKEISKTELCEDWDIGYKILIDKDGLTVGMTQPTYQVSIIKQPDADEFEKLLNDFWWDTTYVAKCLARSDIFYAKFMLENNIRTEYLKPLIEWYIASDHNWKITTNKHGRLFEQYLPSKMWQRILQTFSGHDTNQNWDAMFAMADLVNEMGTYLSAKLNYKYPTQLEADIRKYLIDVCKKGTN